MENQGLSNHPDTEKIPGKGSEKLGRKGFILTVGIYVVVVSLIIGLPFYFKILAPRWHTILQGGDVSVTSQDLVKRLRLHSPVKGIDQLETATNVLQEIQNQELIKQEAVKQKITVSPQELDREIRRRVMASAPAEGKFEDLYPILLRRMGLKEREFQTWVKADIYRGRLFQSFLAKQPDQAEQVHLLAIVTGTSLRAEAVRTRLLKGEDFSGLAKATSIDIETAPKGGDFGWIPKGVNDLTTPGQIRAVGILTKTETEAKQIRELVLGGHDVGKLARKYSLDKETGKEGGSLGWVSTDLREGKPFAADVYGLNPGEVSPPIQTPEGFWIIKLIDKSPRGKMIDDIVFHLPAGQVSPPLNTVKGFYILKIAARELQRPLSPEHKTLLGEKAFADWLTAIAEKGRKEGRIKWDWGSETFNWVITHLN